MSGLGSGGIAVGTEIHETTACRYSLRPQAPLSTALLSTGCSGSGWRFGFSSASAQNRAAGDDKAAAADQQAAAGGESQEQQQQAGEQQAEAIANMTPEQLARAYQEAHDALESERKRVSIGLPLHPRDGDRQHLPSLLSSPAAAGDFIVWSSTLQHACMWVCIRGPTVRAEHPPTRAGCLAVLQAEDLKDKLLRTLADMENLRERTARTSAETKQFAVQVGERGAWAASSACAWQSQGVLPLHRQGPSASLKTAPSAPAGPPLPPS